MNPRVLKLQTQPDHRLLRNFDNGETRLFDLTPWLDTGVFRVLRDSPSFALAQVVDGSVEWPGEIDLSYDTIYLRSVASPEFHSRANIIDIPTRICGGQTPTAPGSGAVRTLVTCICGRCGVDAGGCVCRRTAMAAARLAAPTARHAP